ncbi:MAG: amino acid ABC transporter permease [Burkholderiales bacterium]
MSSTIVENFFNPVIAARYWPDILRGAVVTIELGVLIVVSGLLLGLGLAILRALQIRPFTWLIIAFADVFRALPPLVTLVLVYFALPFVDIEISGFVATWATLALSLAAFAEETFWAGILSVDKGQWEASRSTGLTYLQTLGFVVLPQAVRMTIPSLTNRTIAITKMTAIASVVAVEEILANAATAQAYSANTTPITMAAFAYLAIFVPLVVFSRWVERRFAWRR